MIEPNGPDLGAIEIDTRSAHPARVYDFLLGGVDNFAVDREAAARGSAALPGGIALAREMVRAQRQFLVRAVRHLAGEQDVRQFLDIGTGIPNTDSVNAVAQQTARDARIVYVDNDPVVLAHAHKLLRSTPEGATDYIQADLRHPRSILHDAAATLDFAKPIGLILVGVLHLVPDEDNPYALVAGLLNAVPSGSYLALSHLASDLRPELAEVMRRVNETMSDPFIFRSHTEVARFVAGLEVLEPRIVTLDRWHPQGTPAPSRDGPEVAAYGGVARKP